MMMYDPDKKELAAARRKAHSEQLKALYPIRDFLESTIWDGVPRLDTLLSRVFGTEENAYTTSILRKWMVAAISRVYQPGEDFRNVLIAAGGSSDRASTFFQKLSRGWGVSTAFEKMRGFTTPARYGHSLIVEIEGCGLLAGSKKHDLHQHASISVDWRREAFSEISIGTPRVAVFAAGVIEVGDLEGFADFWAFRAITGKETLSVRSREFDEMIPQLWAEAMAAYLSGEGIKLSRKEKAARKQSLT